MNVAYRSTAALTRRRDTTSQTTITAESALNATASVRASDGM